MPKLSNSSNAEKERERLDALAKWARRVVKSGESHRGPEARRDGRSAVNIELVLIPLEAETLRPDLSRRINAIAKDMSRQGIGIVSNIPLEDDLYFCDLRTIGGILLIRRVRERAVLGSIREYGFMMLDRYASLQQLCD